ncbi:endonuclease/exonuclease/phosphatase family protein, partial [Kaarinaea lacus]
AKAFSLASWNVEHFKGKPERISRVVDFLSQQSPDVFGLYEVEGKHVYRELSRNMPGYSFHITEGTQTQEILIGVKNRFTAFFSQRVAFKSGNQYLRPGALLSLSINNVDYSILFLHLKSNNKPIGLGLRDDQISKSWDLKKKLDKASGGKANFIVLGDLNTMGMKYPYHMSITADTELKKLDLDTRRRKMTRLVKTHEFTWWNGPGSSLPPANLDQVIAAEHLRFKMFKRTDNSRAPIDVRGWPQLPEQQQKDWITQYSDHALLYLEVQKVT